MFPARLAAEIRTAVAELVPPADLPDATPAEWIRRPRRADLGDFTTPAGRRWAAAAGVPPGQLAGALARRLRGIDGVARCEATGDGFVNIHAETGALADIVREIVAPARPAHDRSAEQSRHGRPSLAAELAAEMRYAHARMCGFLRSAAALDIVVDPDRIDATWLDAQPARRLVCALAEFPSAVARSARGTGPARTHQRPLNSYLTELLELLADFEDAGGILPKGAEAPAPRHSTRLMVVDASRAVLANALRTYGLDAPSRW
ncbi:MAG: DALR anticodon-binding domain-containing protein [Actinopolymorphaceae bacterium]